MFKKNEKDKIKEYLITSGRLKENKISFNSLSTSKQIDYEYLTDFFKNKATEAEKRKIKLMALTTEYFNDWTVPFVRNITDF